MGELAVVHVNRANVQAHDLGVLNGQMSQAADAGNGDPLTGLRAGFLDAFIGGDARANDRCRFRGFQPGRYVGDVIRIPARNFSTAEKSLRNSSSLAMAPS
jgi:hypothetical protein